MLPPSVQNAIEILARAKEEKRELSEQIPREIVDAYSTVSIFKHHFLPSESGLIDTLLMTFRQVPEKESTRYLRERRLALARIMVEVRVKERF